MSETTNIGKDFEGIIKNARSLLAENTWVEQYKAYAEAMLANAEFIEEKRGNFNEWAPLFFYINTTKAMKYTTKLTLDVRYMGQTVATLTCDKNNYVTINTKEYDSKNYQNFCCTIQLHDVDWKDAGEFRKYFRDREKVRNDKKKCNKEHNIESMLLTGFTTKKGVDKFLRGIKPVKFAEKIRFAMPTVLSASDHNNLRFAKKGGGIDILARVEPARLCVIEVKDEITKAEPPDAALQQAVEYTVFIRELLRSKAGPLWWKLFGFNREIPAPGKLTICAACAMQVPETDVLIDESFGGKRFDIDGDCIECHYIYFVVADDNTSLKLIKTSLGR